MPESKGSAVDAPKVTTAEVAEKFNALFEWAKENLPEGPEKTEFMGKWHVAQHRALMAVRWAPGYPSGGWR